MLRRLLRALFTVGLSELPASDDPTIPRTVCPRCGDVRHAANPLCPCAYTPHFCRDYTYPGGKCKHGWNLTSDVDACARELREASPK